MNDFDIWYYTFVFSSELILLVQDKHRGSALDGAWRLPTGFIQEVRK
jgi:hypothetical protein